MTGVLARGSRDARPTVPRRGPARSVMTEILRIQASARRPSIVARLFGKNPVRPDARSWYRAALAEISLARSLTSLPEGWIVLQAVPVGAGDSVDNVVIGPTGVFTISVKDHSAQRVWVGDDRIVVNGHRTHHIADARREASRISRVLGAGPDGPVTPIIAVVDPGSLAVGRDAPTDVVIVRADRLVARLTRGRRTVSSAAVEALARRAEGGGELARSQPSLDTTLRHATRFARLKHEVDAAWRRRTAWLVILAVTPMTAVVLGIVLANG
jgi:hypothetical protein